MLVHNHLIPELDVQKLIAEIKKKKELRALSDDFVKDKLFQFLQSEPKITHLFAQKCNPKSAEYRQTVKHLRAQLRRIHGVFRITDEVQQRRAYFAELLKADSEKTKTEMLTKILQTHASTRERMPFYAKLYASIFHHTGNPETILDLGCGINPFSFSFMQLKNMKYFACDVNIEEVELVDDYFKYLHKRNKHFSGKAEILDTLHWVKLRQLVKAEICFLFKMTDVLDQGKGHQRSEEVIKNVPAKFVIVSFPTKTMSGRPMNFPRRTWIELMAKRLGYQYKTLEFLGEIFYLIDKRS